MRHVVTLIVLLAVATTASCGETSPSAQRARTTAELARLAFDALQADDFERLRQALPTATDTVWMMDRVMEGKEPEYQQRTRDMLEKQGGPEAVAAKAEERVRASFDAARQAAAEHLDWAAASFGGLLEEKSKVTSSDGLDFADPIFLIRAGERQEVVGLARCVRIEDRWVVTAGLRYRPSPHASLDEAKVSMARQHLRMLRDAAKLHELHGGSLPESIDVLQQPDATSGQALVQPDFVDPWGNPYRLEVVHDAVRVTSAGPDGALDTEDDLVEPRPDAN